MRNFFHKLAAVMAFAAAGTGVVAWGYFYLYKTPLYKGPAPVTISQPKAPGDADIICYSLLKDYSEDSVMKGKVREVLADGSFSDDDCKTLVDYDKVVKEEERTRRKIEYFQQAQKNLGN